MKNGQVLGQESLGAQQEVGVLDNIQTEEHQGKDTKDSQPKSLDYK